MLIILSAAQAPGRAQFLSGIIDTLKHKRSEKIKLTDRWHVSGTSFGFALVQDTKMSPLIYAGPGTGLYWQTFRTVPKWLHLTGFTGRYSALGGPDEFDNIVHTPHFRFYTGSYRNIKKSGFSAGGSFNAEARGRIYPKIANDALNTDFAASLFAGGFYRYKMQVFRQAAFIIAGAETALYSYLLRFPKYNISGTEQYLAPLGVYNQFKFHLGIVKQMKHSKENKIGIKYDWDMVFMKEDEGLHKLVSGNHFITISFWLKRM